MYVDAMTKKNGNIPLLQILMRTGRIRITKRPPFWQSTECNPRHETTSPRREWIQRVRAVNKDARPERLQKRSSLKRRGVEKNGTPVNLKSKRVCKELSTSVSIHSQCCAHSLCWVLCIWHVLCVPDMPTQYLCTTAIFPGPLRLCLRCFLLKVTSVTRRVRRLSRDRRCEDNHRHHIHTIRCFPLRCFA